MHLDQLRYLILIDKLGSIHKAAELAHISHQALNKSMKSLEAELDCALFSYHARGVALTEKGLMLADTAEDVVKRMDDVIAKLHQNEPISQPKTEELTIFYSPAISNLNISYITQIFVESNPNVQMTLIEEETDQIKKIIFDYQEPALGLIAAIEPVQAVPNQKILQFYQDKLYAVVSLGHPLAKQKSVSLRTLLKYPLAIYQSNYYIANPLKKFLDTCGTPIYQVITNNTQIYRNAISNQHCVAFINKAARKKHTAFQTIADEIVYLPITNIPPIIMEAIMTEDYLACHETSIKKLLSLCHALC